MILALCDDNVKVAVTKSTVEPKVETPAEQPETKPEEKAAEASDDSRPIGRSNNCM